MQIKDRHRSFIEIKHDLEELVKYYPDYVAYTVFEVGRPEVIVVGKDAQAIAEFPIGDQNMPEEPGFDIDIKCRKCESISTYLSIDVEFDGQWKLIACCSRCEQEHIIQRGHR